MSVKTPNKPRLHSHATSKNKTYFSGEVWKTSGKKLGRTRRGDWSKRIAAAGQQPISARPRLTETRPSEKFAIFENAIREISTSRILTFTSQKLVYCFFFTIKRQLENLVKFREVRNRKNNCLNFKLWKPNIPKFWNFLHVCFDRQYSHQLSTKYNRDNRSIIYNWTLKRI